MEKHKLFQVGVGYLDFDIKIKKDDHSNFSITVPGHNVIRLVNDAFAYTLNDARISASAGVEIEKKLLGLYLILCD